MPAARPLPPRPARLPGGGAQGGLGLSGRDHVPGTIRYLLEHWDEETARHHDLRMPRLAARATAIYFHVPSLVQHRQETSTWGNAAHQAPDFDPLWKAPDRYCNRNSDDAGVP